MKSRQKITSAVREWLRKEFSSTPEEIHNAKIQILDSVTKSGWDGPLNSYAHGVAKRKLLNDGLMREVDAGDWLGHGDYIEVTAKGKRWLKRHGITPAASVQPVSPHTLLQQQQAKPL